VEIQAVYSDFVGDDGREEEKFILECVEELDIR
jgi:hypothetical protein